MRRLGIAAFAVVVVSSFPEVARAACQSEAQDDICVPRDIYFMPGVEGIVYAPRGSHDPYFGAGVQLAPYLWSHNNDHFGPSQGAVYAEAALLSSSSGTSSLALYDVGFDLSLERNSSRIWLIPYFGSNVGGSVSSELPNTSFVYPFAGVHLLWHQNLVFDAEGGYHFPFEHIDVMRGPRAQLTLRFSLW